MTVSHPLSTEMYLRTCVPVYLCQICQKSEKLSPWAGKNFFLGREKII